MYKVPLILDPYRSKIRVLSPKQFPYYIILVEYPRKSYRYSKARNPPNVPRKRARIFLFPKQSLKVQFTGAEELINPDSLPKYKRKKGAAFFPTQQG